MSRKEIKAERIFWIVFSILTFSAGLALGGIYGRETAPKTLLKITKNGTLAAYDIISLTNQLPNDLSAVTRITNKHRIIFLWTAGGSTNRYLYVMVLDK